MRTHASLTEEPILRSAHKWQSLDLLAGSLAHDLNNLLTGVLGNAGLVRMLIGPTSEAHRPLEQIEVGAIRAANICRQLQTFTGKGGLAVGTVSLLALVTETVEALRPTFPAESVLSLDLSKSPAEIEADASLLRQALANLIVNALESLPAEGGQVEVRIEPCRLDTVLTRFADFTAPNLIEGEAIALEVRDNGHGLTAEVRERMFEPFFTTRFRGRGLGLAVVLGVVRSHRGAIFVDSHQEHGTTIRLVIPTNPQRTVLSPRGVAGSSASGIVLVADDEIAVRTVTGRMLESAGYRVLLATDGLDAIEKYRSNAEAVRLALVDLTMPRLSGDDAFRVLRRLRANLPVVLMSGYPEPDVMSRFIGCGLSAFLQKPFRPLDLLEIVRRHYRDQ